MGFCGVYFFEIFGLVVLVKNERVELIVKVIDWRELKKIILVFDLMKKVEIFEIVVEGESYFFIIE